MFNTPTITKNLLIINVLAFVATLVFPSLGDLGGLHFFLASDFHVYQLFTYMFLHANFTHILFNMFALWMFGRGLEYEMGSRRFLTYYLVCGVGAALIQLGVNWLEYSAMLSSGTASPAALWSYAHATTIGASGAVFGLLLAFGMMHPNSVIMLVFPPIALKAKWFVIIYGAIELLAGVSGTGGGVAHFAHLGGMLFGWLLLRWWKKKRKIYY